MYKRQVLVIIVIFLFLRSWRAVLIPLVTIPLSLVGAFALMYVFGFTINTLTLLAMVLAVVAWFVDAVGFFMWFRCFRPARAATSRSWDCRSAGPAQPQVGRRLSQSRRSWPAPRLADGRRCA